MLSLSGERSRPPPREVCLEEGTDGDSREPPRPRAQGGEGSSPAGRKAVILTSFLL